MTFHIYLSLNTQIDIIISLLESVRLSYRTLVFLFHALILNKIPTNIL